MTRMPWPDEMKREIQKFGDLLLSLKRFLADARAAGLPAYELDMAEIDLLLDEYEKEMSESHELQRKWEAKQPELQELERKSQSLLERAKKSEIHSREDYERAKAELAEIDAHQKLIDSIFDPFTKAYAKKLDRLNSIKQRIMYMCRLEKEGSA